MKKRAYELVNIDSHAVIETGVLMTWAEATERNRLLREDNMRDRWIPVGDRDED